MKPNIIMTVGIPHMPMLRHAVAMMMEMENEEARQKARQKAMEDEPIIIIRAPELHISQTSFLPDAAQIRLERDRKQQNKWRARRGK